MSFDTLPPETRLFLDSVPALIDKVFPMPVRFRRALPSHVAELSRLLTAGRGERPLSYLSRPNVLSAYLRYFLPWNLCRLCLLLPGLNLKLSSGDTITDLGCGPLTLTAALWISRPDLRNLPLEFRCVDRCAPVLEAGKIFFNAIASDSPWKIRLIRKSIDVRAKANAARKEKPAALVCAINTLNEIYENLSHCRNEELKHMAVNIARTMHGYAAHSGCVLIVEPGVPHSGHCISLLRTAFLKLNRPPLEPCPHTEPCPLSGGKKRWCHFAFETADAPKDLRRLSAAAGIPKERLVLSYLLAGPANKSQPKNLRVKAQHIKTRVISDAFPLPHNRYGRYGCSSQGLVLLTGEKSHVAKAVSGSMVIPIFAADGQRDAKSGALMAELS